ncbi:MAG: trypsin-like peptidase domain-containing protein, partial [Fervidicoccaceae archaeon]
KLVDRMSIDHLSKDIVRIVEQAKESVVTIASQIPHPLTLFGFEPLKSFGSGFLVEEGFIITNAHVVQNAKRVNVMYWDGYAETAEVIASDNSRDLALLEATSHGKPIGMGDSENINVGEIVLAIGSPLGLPGPSVSMGIVSATGRIIVNESFSLEDLIQTDAAINPGNSGGPLVNLRGEAIGVTTAIVPFAQGIGFALPINSVKRFIYMLRKFGKPVRAWIGVNVTSIGPMIARMYGLGAREGLMVVRVIPGTPASKAGLREGDVILKANGRVVRKVSNLREAIEDSVERGRVKIEIKRGEIVFETDVDIIVEEL